MASVDVSERAFEDAIDSAVVRTRRRWRTPSMPPGASGAPLGRGPHRCPPGGPHSTACASRIR